MSKSSVIEENFSEESSESSVTEEISSKTEVSGESETKSEETPPPKKRKVDFTPARQEALKRAREQKAIKKTSSATKKTESALFRSVEDEQKLFDLWQKKQALKKDNAWTAFLNSRLNDFEDRILEVISGRQVYEERASSPEVYHPPPPKQKPRAPAPKAIDYRNFF